MKSFFQSVRKHIDKLDATHLREQYALISDEVDFLDTLFETIDRGIIVLDAKGEVTRSNPAAKALLGMDAEDAMRGLDVPLGKMSKREMMVSYPEERSLEMQTIPLVDGGTLVYLSDTTAQKARTEEELKRGASEAVKGLAAGLAHEIGNPLNALSLNLQLMQRSDVKEPEMIATCRQQIARLDGIIRGYLTALRPTKPNLMPGSIAEPLKNCLATLKQQFEERKISVVLDVPAAVPSVALDVNQMEQVYFNLIKNALEAMQDGGTISIAVTADDNDVAIAFRDSGHGMTAEQLAHLFVAHRTTKEKGSGLGLMISSRIVHDHGGTIGAESKVGEGTVFTVKLPRLERRIRELK
jgi:two-component system, sporulation sensor kinase E